MRVYSNACREMLLLFVLLLDVESSYLETESSASISIINGQFARHQVQSDINGAIARDCSTKQSQDLS